MLREVRAALDAVDEHPRFRELPCVVDECDASVPAHWGVYDNANFAYRNTEYFPVFQCKLMKKLLDLDERGGAQVHLATTWSFYFEGERLFEGTRSLFTAQGVEKPVLNAYRMLGRLGDTRLAVESSDAWPLDQYAADTAAREVALSIERLPFAGPVRVRHWRIDARHSNSHTAWQALGQPQDPSEGQLRAIKERQGLELLEPEREIAVAGGRVTLTVALPLPSVSLLEIRAAG